MECLPVDIARWRNDADLDQGLDTREDAAIDHQHCGAKPPEDDLKVRGNMLPHVRTSARAKSAPTALITVTTATSPISIGLCALPASSISPPIVSGPSVPPSVQYMLIADETAARKKAA